MGAVVSFIEDVVSGVVDAVGDVVEEVVNVAEKVIETVAENPILIVAAIAAPYALGALAAEAGVVGALEVATAAEAVETGAAVLEATGTATAVASAETAAAATVIEGGATVAEATTAASLAADGATVAEAVSSATAGAVETSALTEVASTATETMTNAWETISQAAQNITSTIGETLAPGADPMLQKLAGQVAVNTATNGGDFEKALLNTGLSFGTGFLGSEIADVTGSDLAGRVAANSAKQLVTTGDIDLTKLAGSELGKFVGNEVADETGSDLAGKAASSVTNSTVQGKDATAGLLGLGVGEIVNGATNTIDDFIKSSGVDSSVTGEDQSGVTKTGSVEGGLTAVANNDAKNDENIDTTTGGLNQVIDTSDATTNPSTPTTLTGEKEIDRAVDDIISGTSTAPTGEDTTVSTVDTPVVNEVPVSTEVPVNPETPPAPTGGLNQIAADTSINAPETSVTAPTTATTNEENKDVLSTIGEEKPVPTEEPDIKGVAKDAAAVAGAATAAGAGTSALIKNLTSVVTNKAKTGLTKSLTKSLTSTKAPVRNQLTSAQMAAMKVAATKPSRPPIQMDVSKLIPVAKKTSTPLAPPAKIDVSKLTPVKNIASLTSILNKAKKPG